MPLRSQAVWLVPAALTLFSVGAGAKSAIAQTTFDLETIYNTEVSFIPITENVSQVTVSGSNANAPFGLTSFISANYSQLDPSTGRFTFDADPATFGLEGLPILTDVFFQNGDDRLFGNSGGNGLFDFANGKVTGSGMITVTGGEGRFQGATGTLNFFEEETLSSDPTAPAEGQALVTGSFRTPQAVPEPRTNATLVGIGALGFGLLLRKNRDRSSK